METLLYEFRAIGRNEFPQIKELFTSVFTREPWNDDWSDQQQLDHYLADLIDQSNSLTYGLFDGELLIGLSMGRIKHWYSGTEYCIDELCIQTERQQNGIGTYFLNEIQKHIRDLGLTQIYLQTENNVPAYDFYRKNGFHELKSNVSFAKQV